MPNLWHHDLAGFGPLFGYFWFTFVCNTSGSLQVRAASPPSLSIKYQPSHNPDKQGFAGDASQLDIILVADLLCSRD